MVESWKHNHDNWWISDACVDDEVKVEVWPMRTRSSLGWPPKPKSYRSVGLFVTVSGQWTKQVERSVLARENSPLEIYLLLAWPL